MEVGPGIVKILRRADGKPVGLGFVVAERQLLTAAHVVNTALGRDREAVERPQGEPELDVVFSLLGGPEQPVRRATLKAWMLPGRTDIDGADIAGLELMDGEDLPGEARPLLLEDRRHGTTVRLYGPVLGRRRGGYTDGQLMGTVEGGRVQIDQTGGGVFQAQPGWSGGPVWDVVSGNVVGMLVAAADADDGQRVVDAYAIPAATLAAAWSPVLEPVLIPPNPYKGLQAFTESDATRFFGRAEFQEAILHDFEQRSVVTVFGRSGEGKSSLINAGIVPRLRRQGWLVASCRPGPHPHREVVAAVANATTARLHGEQLAKWQAEPTGAGLVAVGRQAATHDDLAGLVLVVDQFEEVLSPTTEPIEAQALLDLLTEALDGVQSVEVDVRRTAPALAPLQLLLSLRSDRWGPLVAETGRFGQLIASTGRPLGEMTPTELRQAITEPARTAGVAIEEALVNRLVGEVEGRPGHLPLLSVALERLWLKQRDRKISMAAYDEQGTVSEALARYAEEVYASLTSDEQRVARRVLTSLVVLGQEATRRRARRDELRTDDWWVVQRLVDDRLLVSDRDETGAETVEPAHEALIRGWDRLQDWIADDRRFLDWRQRTARRQEEWEATDRQSGFLDGQMLQDALQWLRQRPDDVAHGLRQFVELSQRHESEEQDRHRRAAEERVRRARAEARQLALQSEQVRATDPRAALDLAIKSLETNPSAEADAATRRALDHVHATRPVADHGAPAQAVAFSLDGSLIATAGIDGTARVVDVDTGDERIRIAQDGGVHAVAFSPDGSLLGTAGMDGTARVVDVVSGMERYRVRHGGDVLAVAFSPDGTLMATGAEDGTARIVDLATGEARIAADHGDHVFAVTFSPDSRFLGTASFDGTARQLATAAGNEVVRITHEAPIHAIGFTEGDDPDDWWLVSATSDASRTKVTPVGAGHRAWRLPVTHQRQVTAAELSADGTLLVTAGSDRTARIARVADRTSRARFPVHHDAEVTAVAISRDAALVASADRTGAVRVASIDQASGVARCRLPAAVTALAISPDGGLVATATEDGTVWVIDVAPVTADVLRITHGDRVVAVAFDDDSTRLTTAALDGTARVVDVELGVDRLHVLFTPPPSSRVGPLALSGRGKLLAVAHGDDVTLVDVSPGATPRLLSDDPLTDALVEVLPLLDDPSLPLGDHRHLHSTEVRTITSVVRAMTPDERRDPLVIDGDRRARIAAETGTSSVEVYRIAGLLRALGKARRSRASDSEPAAPSSLAIDRILDEAAEGAGSPGTGRVTALAFSPDETKIAIGHERRRARVVDVVSGATELVPAPGPIPDLIFSPSGRLLVLALAADADDLDVYYARENRGAMTTDVTVMNLVSGTGEVTAADVSTIGMPRRAQVAFSPDERHLATAHHRPGRYSSSRESFGAAPLVRVVALAEGAGTREIVHDGGVVAVAFSPDGRYLATGSNRTARVTDRVLGTEVLPISHDDTVTALAWSPDGRYLATASADRTVQVTDVAEGNAIARVPLVEVANDVTFSPDGRLLAVATGDTVRVTAFRAEDVIALAHTRTSGRRSPKPHSDPVIVDLRPVPVRPDRDKAEDRRAGAVRSEPRHKERHEERHRDDAHRVTSGGDQDPGSEAPKTAPTPVAVQPPGCAEGLLVGAVFLLLGLLILSPIIGFQINNWDNLTDVTLKHESGDEPATTDSADVSGGATSAYGGPHGGSDDWRMDQGSGSEITTTYRLDGRPRVDSLARQLELRDDDESCPDAGVSWRISVGDDTLATGTLESGETDELGRISSQRAPATLTITARRTDEERCRVTLRWVDPGFNGPGLGKFRLTWGSTPSGRGA